MASTRRRRTAAVLFGFVAVFVLASPVAAQDDPYGGTTTTHPPRGPRPSCRVQGGSVTPGSTAVARVHAAPRGSTVQIFFDGERVAEGRADGPGRSQQVNTDISYTVPDVEPGSYPVTAVGASFTASCGDQRVKGGTEVDGEQIGSETARGSGSLPTMWLAIGVLVVVALARILAGHAIKRRSELDRTVGSVEARDHRA